MNPSDPNLVDLTANFMAPFIANAGNRLLNVGPMEMYSVEGKPYIRTYMAVFGDAVKGNLTEVPKHKDIWQDSEGHIYMYPEGSTLWVSFGQALRQLKFAEKYFEQSEKKGNPLIKSFLVPTETVLDIIKDTAAEEYKSKFHDLSYNVDKHYGANQFGLKGNALEQLRQNALNGSLVTFGYKNIDPTSDYLGTFKLLQALRDNYNLPSKEVNLVGLGEDYKDFTVITNGAGEFLKQADYEFIGRYLTRLNAYYKNNPALLPEGDTWPSVDLLNTELDTFYEHNNLQEEDARAKFFNEVVSAWASQATIASFIARNYEENERLADPDKLSTFTQSLVDISKDEMLGSNFDASAALTESGRRRKALQERAANLEAISLLNAGDWFAGLPANSKVAVLIGQIRDSLRAKLNNKLGRPANDKSKDLSKFEIGIGLDDLKEAFSSTAEEGATKINDILNTASLQDQEKWVLNGFKRILSQPENINDVATYLIVKTRDHKEITTYQNLFARQQELGSQIETFFLDDEGKLKRLNQGQEELAFGVLGRQKKVVFADIDPSHLEIDQIASTLRDNFMGQQLRQLEFWSVYPGKAPFLPDSFLTAINQALAPSGPTKGGIAIKQICSVQGEISKSEDPFLKINKSITYDVIANRRSTMEGAITNILGTPVTFSSGIPHVKGHEYGKYYQTIERHFGEGFQEAVRNQYTGVVYFEEKDPITEKQYQAIAKNDWVQVAESNLNLLLDNIGDTLFGRIFSKYDNQIIVSLDDSEATQTAARFLQQKYSGTDHPLAQNTFMAKMENGKLQFEKPVTPPEINKQTRIQFVGHGQLENDKLTISQKTPKDLGGIVKSLVKPGEEIGRISMVACNFDPDPNAAAAHSKTFVSTILKDLLGSNIRTTVSARNTLVRVDKFGHKQYGTVIEAINGEPTQVRWHYRQKTDKIIGQQVDGQIKIQAVDNEVMFPLITSTASSSLGLESSLINSDDDYGMVLNVRGARRRAASLYQSTESLLSAENLSDRWMPILNSDSIIQTGRSSFNVDFINQDTEEIRTLQTDDPVFKDFQKYIDEQAEKVQDIFISPNEGLRPLEASDVDGSIDALNAAFAAQTIMEFFQGSPENARQNPNISQSLAMAMKIKSYINYIGMAYGLVQDAHKVSALVKTLVRTEGIAAKNEAEGAVGAIGHIGGEAFGFVLGASNVILDSLELSDATTVEQKAIFGTQLAFDSANLIVSGAGITAGVMGAATVGAVLGGVGVLLGGFTIAFNALAEKFSGVYQSAVEAGEKIQQLYEANKTTGYIYNAQNSKVLRPVIGVVIKSIDFTKTNKQITFGSHYVYTSKMVWGGSSVHNYFFSMKDFPYCDQDAGIDRQIRLRDAFNKKDPSNFPDQADLPQPDTHLVMLPNTVPVHYYYGMTNFPGATTRSGTGFDLFRYLETFELPLNTTNKDHQFAFDFYVFPSEYIIDDFSSYYGWDQNGLTTYITADQQNRQFFLPNPGVKYYDYWFKAITRINSIYTITLFPENDIVLPAAPFNNGQWILDAAQLGELKLSFGKGTLNDGEHFYGSASQVKVNILTINGNVNIKMPEGNQPSVVLIDKDRTISMVNFSAQEVVLSNIDIKKWPTGSETVKEHLDEMAEKHLLNTDFVILDNYSVDNIPGTIKAFYEVKKERDIYTRSPVTSFISNPTLIAVVDDLAYFVNYEQQVIWVTNAVDKQVKYKYELLFRTDKTKLEKVWREKEDIMVAQSILIETGEKLLLFYQLWKEQLILTSITADADRGSLDMTFIGGMEDGPLPAGMQLLSSLVKKGELTGSLQSYIASQISVGTPLSNVDFLDFNGVLVESFNAPLITFTTRFNPNENNQNLQRFWLRRQDGKVILPDLGIPVVIDIDTGSYPAVLINADMPTQFWVVPYNLVYVACLRNKEGEEAFFFFSHRTNRLNQKLFVQVGRGPMEVIINKPSAIEVQLPGLKNILTQKGNIYALLDNGVLLQLHMGSGNQVETSLISIDEKWLKKTPDWKTAFNDLMSSYPPMLSTIGLLGFKDLAGHDLSVWYDVSLQKMVLAPSGEGKQKPQYLGMSLTAHAAWFYVPDNQTIYLQKVLPIEQLRQHFTANLQQTLAIGFDSLFVSKPEFVRAYLKNGYVVGETTDGRILRISPKGATYIILVKDAWREKHQNALPEALKSLAKQYKTLEIIGLLDKDSPKPSNWYHVASETLFGPQDSFYSSTPWQIEYFGFDSSTNIACLVDKVNHKAFAIYGGETSPLGDFTKMEKMGSILYIKGLDTSQNKIKPPVIDGCSIVYFEAGRHSLIQDDGKKFHDVFLIDAAIWSHYQGFILDAIPQKGFYLAALLQISALQANFLVITRDGDHVVLADPFDQKYILIKNLLSPNIVGYHFYVGISGHHVIDLLDLRPRLMKGEVIAIKDLHNELEDDSFNRPTFQSLTAGVEAIGAPNTAPGPIKTSKKWTTIAVTPQYEALGQIQSPGVLAAARKLHMGRVFAIGHSNYFGAHAEEYDNLQFFKNVVAWLDQRNSKNILLLKTRWSDPYEKTLNKYFVPNGYTFQVATLNDYWHGHFWQGTPLKNFGLIIIPTQWQELQTSQQSGIYFKFVGNGGGLLLTGLGWSYKDYENADLSQFPMNQIGKAFEMRFADGYLRDEHSNLNNDPSHPIIKSFL